MSVPAAYLGIILIWSTTPLALQWSIAGVGFAGAVFVRMAIGLVVAGLLMMLWRIRLPLHRRACLAYGSGGLGLFGAMALTYWGARFVPSGLISVMFGLSPLMAGVMARFWLGENSLSREKLIGTLMGAAGLAVIFLQGGLSGGPSFLAGLTAELAAVFIYTGSMISLKRIGDDSPPLATTVGTLAVSLPFFALVWYLSNTGLPVAAPTRSLAAIAYLGVFGSVVGFALYYYVIKHLPASRVSLITLVTPVLALLLGHGLNGEQVGTRVWLGTGLILLGLVLHQAQTLLPLMRRLRPA